MFLTFSPYRSPELVEGRRRARLAVTFLTSEVLTEGVVKAGIDFKNRLGSGIRL